MTLPYSTRFLSGQAYTGTEHYTVPSGYRAVLKDIDCLTQDATSSQVAFQVAGVSIAAFNTPAGQLYTFQWRGMAVFYAGEQLTVICSQPISFMCSGYLLLDP
jgi:hypothetical protein